MGSGLCRNTDGKPRAVGVDGLYRQIVFNYAKQCTRSNKRTKRDKTNIKQNKRDKPIISGPFPVDPDRLEGDKWRYVILTRLDTEPPPERPPRTKRRRRSQQQQQQHWDSSGDGRSGASGLWDSVRRRRRSNGSARLPSPARPCRRRAGRLFPGVAAVTADTVQLITSTLFHVYWCRRLPADRSLPWQGDSGPPAKRSDTCPPPPERKASVSDGKTATRRNGLIASVGCVSAMTDNLLSSR